MTRSFIFTAVALALLMPAGQVPPAAVSPALAQAPEAANETNRAPFALVDHAGRKVTDRDYLGRYLLIFFGYTNCPDICPTDLAVMSWAVDELGEDGEQVQPIFITLDPARDTLEVLSDFVGHFHPRLVGLTGAREDIAAVATRYGVRSAPYRPDGDTESDGGYFLDHTGAIYLLGPDGAGLTYFLHGVGADEIAAVIRRFMEREG